MDKTRLVMFVAGFVLAGWLAPSLASAQFIGGFWQGRAATAGESHARGFADVIRSHSEAQLRGAMAAREFEEARRSYLENREFAARSYIERRRLRDEYRESGYSSRFPNKEKLAAYVESRRLAPLTSSEFDETSGEVAWPLPLALPQDEETRQQVSEMCRKWARDEGLEPEEIMELSELLREWRNDLAERRDSLSDSEFSYAARFLGRLDAHLKGDFE